MKLTRYTSRDHHISKPGSRPVTWGREKELDFLRKELDFLRNAVAYSPMDQADVASQFMSLTSCTDTEASFYLEAANYDLDRAVAMYFGEQQASRSQL